MWISLPSQPQKGLRKSCRSCLNLSLQWWLKASHKRVIYTLLLSLWHLAMLTLKKMQVLCINVFLKEILSLQSSSWYFEILQSFSTGFVWSATSKARLDICRLEVLCIQVAKQITKWLRIWDFRKLGNIGKVSNLGMDIT